MAQVEVITGTSRRPYLYRGTEAGAVSHCFISWGVCVRDVIRRHDIRIHTAEAVLRRAGGCDWMCAVDVRMDVDTDRDRRPWHKWKLSPAPQGDVFIPKNKSWLCSLQRFLLGYVCGMWDVTCSQFMYQRDVESAGKCASPQPLTS